MAASVCVSCGKSFTAPGADPVPFCLDCERKADVAYGAKPRRSGVGIVLVALAVVGALTMCFWTMAARDVGQESVAVSTEGR
jgi:hypothetical protein